MTVWSIILPSAKDIIHSGVGYTSRRMIKANDYMLSALLAASFQGQHESYVSFEVTML